MRDMRAIHRAKLFAFNVHGAQQYGREPYFVHLQAVAEMTVKLGGCDVAEQIAWLHDTYEDTDTSFVDLVSNFGERVAGAVLALSKMPNEPYEPYISVVRANALALLVKKADTLCNLTQSTLEGNAKRVMKYTRQLQLLAE